MKLTKQQLALLRLIEGGACVEDAEPDSPRYHFALLGIDVTEDALVLHTAKLVVARGWALRLEITKEGRKRL